MVSVCGLSPPVFIKLWLNFKAEICVENRSQFLKIKTFKTHHPIPIRILLASSPKQPQLLLRKMGIGENERYVTQNHSKAEEPVQ